MPLGGFCGTCRPTPTWNQQGLLQGVKPRGPLSPAEGTSPSLNHTESSRCRHAWDQGQPHSALSPTSPDIKPNLVRHQMQPHREPNPNTPSTASNLTQRTASNLSNVLTFYIRRVLSLGYFEYTAQLPFVSERRKYF